MYDPKDVPSFHDSRFPADTPPADPVRPGSSPLAGTMDRGAAPEPSADDLLRRLGPAIRRARVRLGLSQEDLADRAGLSVQHVQRLENGRRRPRPHDVKVSSFVRLATALGTPREAVVETILALVGGVAEAARRHRG